MWCSAEQAMPNPTVTLNIYAHLLPGQQEQAANAFDVTLRAALGSGANPVPKDAKTSLASS